MLYQLRELSDLFADACVRDETGRLMFLSIHGRDTAIQQLLAALTLRVTEGGFDTLHLRDREGRDHVVHVGDVERLEKFSGRLPKENLFGNLVHLWLYDPILAKPDRGNRVAWLMVDQAWSKQCRDVLMVRAWEACKALSPVPLLDHWRDVVMQRLRAEMVMVMEDTAWPCLGRVSAARVWLPDHFAATISFLVKSGQIGVDGGQRLAA